MSSRGVRRSERGSAASILLIIVLLVITIIVYLATRIPQEASEELPDITEENARSCELKFRLLSLNGKRGKDFSADLTPAELNSLITLGYTIDAFEELKKYTRQGDVNVETLRVKIDSDEILLTFKTYVKFKYLYICLAGKLKTEAGTAVMLVSKVSIGRLPIPLKAAPMVAGIVRPGEEPLSLDVADYVKSVAIEGDKLIITVGK